MRLENKVAVVTGGASGFGEGIAGRFAEEGATVVVSDINDAAGTLVADAVGGSYCHADVTQDADWKGLVDHAVTNHGRLDILVNNAGRPQYNSPMLETDEATFDSIFAVNVKSIYLSALHTVPLFREQGGGVMLNIASTAGLRPRPGLVWYNASKGAVVTLTKSMAVELAPDQVRVNCLCPVAGDTPMLKDFLGPNSYESFKATVPLGRLSTAQDIANAALYLCSDEAELITGVALEVDGGRCI